MTIAAKARRAEVLVRQLLTRGDAESALAELASLYPKYVFYFDPAEGLTVLVPSNQLLLPHALSQGASWLIEVSQHQLILHKCREDDDSWVVAQFQKAVSLTPDNIHGPATEAAMLRVASGNWHPAEPEPEPARPSRWEFLMADDD